MHCKETQFLFLTGLEKDLPFEHKNIDVKVENDIKAMQASQSQLASQRAKRKSCTNISYTEPGLRRYMY